MSLSGPSGKPVTVEYGVKGGTAVLGKDYALPGGALTFEPGETSKTLVVDIKNHGVYDDDKTLELALKNPKNAVRIPYDEFAVGSPENRLIAFSFSELRFLPCPRLKILCAAIEGNFELSI